MQFVKNESIYNLSSEIYQNLHDLYSGVLPNCFSIISVNALLCCPLFAFLSQHNISECKKLFILLVFTFCLVSVSTGHLITYHCLHLLSLSQHKHISGVGWGVVWEYLLFSNKYLFSVRSDDFLKSIYVHCLFIFTKFNCFHFVIAQPN